MTIPIIVWTKLNHHDIGRDAEYYRQVDTPEWVAARIDVYLKCTVASLKRQTLCNFWIWLNCRPGSEELLKPHLDRLAKADVIVSFHAGSPHTANGPLHSGRPSRLPVAMLNDSGRVEQDECWLVRIDSDDMYGPDAIEMIVGEGEEDDKPTGVLFASGHVYDIAADRLWPWIHRSPPFYAERCPRESTYIQAPADFYSHGTFRDAVKPAVIDNWDSFLVLRHPPGPAFHSWQGRLPKGQEITGERKVELLEYYGVPKCT